MANETAAPPKSGKKGMIIWIVLALAAVGGGGALPWVLGGRSSHDAHAPKKIENHKIKQEAILFGDVVVNLGEDRLNRYLRAKIMVAVDEADKKEIEELLKTQKPFLKSWLISYLSDQSTQEVTRKVGVNRLRREIRDHFNAMLYPNGEERIIDVLFDEFAVQ
jgi:flagellar protein FliL